MAIDIRSAVACSRLLLKLAGIKVSEDIVLPPNQAIDASLKSLNKTYKGTRVSGGITSPTSQRTERTHCSVFGSSNPYTTAVVRYKRCLRLLTFQFTCFHLIE